MSYFKDIKENTEVYGLVFGLGVVRSVWSSSHYSFEVYYNNGFTVPYTLDGVPGWSGKLDIQTVFYKNDIDIMDLDFSPSEEVLSPKKIIKLKLKDNLEVKCPSGNWRKSNSCPGYIIEEYLEDKKFHLFRKAK